MSSSLVSVSRASRSVRGLLPSFPISVRSVHLLSKTGLASPCRLTPSSTPLALSSSRHFSLTPRAAEAQAARAYEYEQELDEDAAVDDSIGDENASFEQFKDRIDPEIYKALTVKPFQLSRPSPVQAAVFDLLPDIARPYEPGSEIERDLLVKAKTGTGKTLGFLVPAVQQRLRALEHAGKDAQSPQEARRLMQDYARRNVGTLIISPTRELATQIATEAQKLTQNTDFGVKLFTGGSSRSMQHRSFNNGRRDIVVATPGRLTDFLTSEPEVTESMKNLGLLVLDEADTLLHMGFRQDIEHILTFLPNGPRRQTMLFSATMPPVVMQVARAALSHKHRFLDIVPAKDHSPVHAHIPQHYTVLDDASQQIPHLLRLIAHDQLSNPGKSKVIVFFQTTKMTQLFSTILMELKGDVFPAGFSSRFYEIHSKKAQSSRDNASDSFRHDKSGATVLVTSDVSARGVDYPGVTRVIQVGVPAGREQYIHRIGRTGRAGMSGRGDFVLLPHESKWVRSQLGDVPIKDVSVSQIEQEMQELAEKHDSDPRAFMPPPEREQESRAARIGFGRQQQQRTPGARPARFAPRVKPVVDAIPETVTGFLERLDPEAIEQTYVALLGFYAGQIDDMKASRREVLDGTGDWVTRGLGLPQVPHVSKQMLQKIGMDPDRPGASNDRFGRRQPFTSSFGAQRGGGDRYGSRDGPRTRSSYGLSRSSGASEREWDSGSRGGGFGAREDREGGFGRERQQPPWLSRGHVASRRR